MAREIEIKLRIGDTQALLRRLRKLGARPVHRKGARMWQHNVLFDTPQGGLAKRGQLLRIRTERSVGSLNGKDRAVQALVTFKCPVEGIAGAERDGPPRHRVREETEVVIDDAAKFTRIFEGLGMAGWFRYERYRTTFRLPSSKRWAKGLLIELDETPIGTFVELEGPPEAIDRAATELGFSNRDYILKNYLALYVEECRRRGVEPTHMLFENAGAPKKQT